MIYFDQASTSFPKAPGLGQCMGDFITHAAVNVNRGSYGQAYAVASEVFACRESLASFFCAPDTRNVIFTANVTQSLNMVLQGYLKPGDHVLISPLEHNAVMRPLHQLRQKGIEVEILPTNPMGYLQVDEFKKHLKPRQTKAIICTHASNLSGVVQDLQRIGDFCQKEGLTFIVDAAQTAGLLPIDVQKMHISALCFTGHKALLGPQGIGGIVLSDALAAEMDPLLAGGTGSFSQEFFMPQILPDKFEAGTLNLPGIIGLKYALDYLQSQDLGARLAHELALTARFIEGLGRFAKQLRLIGPLDCQNRVAVVSLTNQTPELDLAFLAHQLDVEFSIQTRVGFHCTPSAHQFYGTAETGALRFSFSSFNTEAEVDFCLNALQKLLLN